MLPTTLPNFATAPPSIRDHLYKSKSIRRSAGIQEEKAMTYRKSSMSENRSRQSKIPKNPKERLEYYIVLARTAASAGETIEAENYFQHAEHYFRLTNKKAT
jgi:hypothetical protein